MPEMRKIRPLIVVFLALLPAISFAQSGKYEEELLSSQQVASERYILNSSIQTSLPENVANAAFISMEGDDNTFTSTQQNTGSSQNPNVVVVIQSGNLNTTNMDQTGEGNRAAVAQTGSGNDYEGRMQGNNNRTTVEQSGNNNFINQALVGDDMNYRLIQQGNNNQINQVENGAQNKGYEVIQQGSNMNITITNGF